jgi:hypothetical protein
MTCERARALLPLYAAHDLDSAREREVAAHAGACAGCRQLVEEFAQSRRLTVEALKTPDFGEAFYAQIRGAVLTEIRRGQRTPSSPSPFALLFGRRLAYAATFAVALLACGLALYHFRRAADGVERQLVSVPAESRQLAPLPQPGVSSQQATVPEETRQRSRPRFARVSPQKNTRRGLPEAASVRAGTRFDARRLPELPLGTNRNVYNIALSSPGVAELGSVNSVARIEIQTADPNIRIIWLAPRESEAPDPNEPKNENGERK